MLCKKKKKKIIKINGKNKKEEKTLIIPFRKPETYMKLSDVHISVRATDRQPAKYKTTATAT